MKWDADITNDPDRGFSLYVELLEDEEARGRVQRNDAGDLELCFYTEPPVRVPVAWLAEILERAQREL